MKSLLDLIKSLYGPKAISSTIGTRTNVVRIPSGKLQKYVSTELNIEAASDNAAKNAYNEMRELIPEVAKMNDSERLIFEGNLRRLKNKLEESGLIQEENVSSGITALESKVEQLKQKGKELEKITGEKTSLTDVLKDFAGSQKGMEKLRDEGLVRTTARQIMYNDIKSGKLKAPKEVEDIITGRASGDPIDSFRKIYGEDALEQLDSLIPDLKQLKTEIEAEKLARSKFKFEPDINRPSGSVSIEEAKKAEQEFGINKPAKVSDFKAEATKRTSIDDLIDEYNANQDRLRLSDEKGGTLIGYEEYIQLQKRNEDIAKALETKGISSKVEETPQAEIIPFRKKPTEPEGKANGGPMGLDYLTGQEPPKNGYAGGGRIGFALGTTYKAVSKIDNPASGLMIQLDRPLQPGDPVGSYYIPPGDRSTLSSIIRDVPQPPAPSITLDAKPAVVRPEDDVVNRYREYFNASKPVQSDLEKRYKELINPSNPMLLTPATGLPVSIPTPVIEGPSFTSPQGEKIRFGGGVIGLIKPNGEPYTGPVPENFNFFRAVAADGGRIGYAEGSDDAPSITLDNHEKAPGNSDKYPVKVGDLELGIMSAMSSGKSTPNPYTKIDTANRNFTVRGKYNVPNTEVSLVGDIGDIRARSTQNINVPQYNYKESIKDVMRLNPYSVGIEYAPDRNKNINLRYDDRGNVSLRGEYKFAKGGLGYLVGE